MSAALWVTLASLAAPGASPAGGLSPGTAGPSPAPAEPSTSSGTSTSSGLSSALELPPRLEALLRTGRWDATPRGFRVIALSHLADGCAAQALAHPERSAAGRDCVQRALARALELRPSGTGVDDVADGLWLGHVGLILGAQDQLGPCPDPALHERVARRLARWSLDEPTRHVPSYGKLPFRWPADQAVVLAGLHRFDQAHQTELHVEPYRAWRALVTERAVGRFGLPWSEATGRSPGAKLPRGCAQSWLARYLTEVDPELSARWWKSYRRHFLVDRAGYLGFREWPPGVDRPQDIDSGPIVAGVGMAASALGIAAARAQGDEALARGLERSADFATQLPLLGAAAEPLIARAIRFQARWQRPLLAQAGP